MPTYDISPSFNNDLSQTVQWTLPTGDNSNFGVIGFNNVVNAVAVQDNDRPIIGGTFTTYNNQSTNYLAQLNNDGSLDDVTFNDGSGFSTTVNSIAIQTDGKILVAGSFTSFNGRTSNRIARLFANGTYDNTFVVGTGFDSDANVIVVQSDGRILVGGAFTTYNGTASNRIARLYSNGTYDSTFVVGTGFSAIGAVANIAIQSDSKIVVGGSFSIYNGTNSNCIARLYSNGTYDTTFVVGTGFDNNVSTIGFQSDGKLIVGGAFNYYGPDNYNCLIRLNANGIVDNTFDTGSSFNVGVNSLIVQPDNKILVGGLFGFATGGVANRISRLLGDGSVDGTFSSGNGFDSQVKSLAIQTDGNILVGGTFSSYNGTSTAYIARLNANGTYDTGFYPGWAPFQRLMYEGANSGVTFSNRNVAGIISTYTLIVTTGIPSQGGVLSATGEVYFVPYTTAAGQKISVTGVVSTYSLVYTATASYIGGVLAPNGDIHFVPQSANRGQRVNASGIVSTYSLVFTTSSGGYAGGVVAPNGEIHFIPVNAPVGQKVRYSGTVINVSTYSLRYSVSSGIAYWGGVLAPNGDIHFVPYSAPVGQKISASGVVSTYSLVFTTSGGAYSGGVLSPNGDIHFIPRLARRGQKIDIYGNVSTYSLAYTNTNTTGPYYGGALAPNGDIHFIPTSTAAVGQKISVSGAVSTYSIFSIGTYSGGILTPNGDIFFVPAGASRGQRISTGAGFLFPKGVSMSPFFNKF